jgi:hypothetical protein
MNSANGAVTVKVAMWRVRPDIAGYDAGVGVEAGPAKRWRRRRNDRILVAQAIVEGITLLTADIVVAQYRTRADCLIRQITGAFCAGG